MNSRLTSAGTGHHVQSLRPCDHCTTTQYIALVVLTGCLLLFFGLMGALTALPNGEIIALAVSATGIAATEVYSRNILVTFGRILMSGLPRDSDK